MKRQPLSDLKVSIQEIIDLITEKNTVQASQKLVEVNEVLEELIDFCDEDEDLIEISRYQVLLNHLHQKINLLKAEMN